MALTPPLTTLWGYGAKWLIHKAGSAIKAGANELWDVITESDEQPPVEWRKLMFSFQRATPVGTEEDFATISMHLAKRSAGAIDGAWGSGDYSQIDANITELWNVLSPLVHVSHTLTTVKYYSMSFNPDIPLGQTATGIDPATGKFLNMFTKSGPPLHIATFNLAGTSNQPPEAYQVAMSVTLRTATRAHWGRVYLPGMSSSDVAGSYGRFAGSATGFAANAFAEFVDDCGKQDKFVVIPMTQADKKYAHALNTVSAVAVDDVPDVVRRRRPKQVVTRSVGTPTP